MSAVLHAYSFVLTPPAFPPLALRRRVEVVVLVEALVLQQACMLEQGRLAAWQACPTLTLTWRRPWSVVEWRAKSLCYAFLNEYRMLLRSASWFSVS